MRGFSSGFVQPLFLALVALLLLLSGCTARQPEAKYQKAPELEGISAYINSEPFKLEDFRGKVVVVDFWTYSCINCIRTLPYINMWNERYSKDGLVIVGVHTPEFEFEKEQSNVRAAVEKYGIKYPVVLDNDYKTWRAFKNAYWPRKYIIDVDGNIRFDHIGEGGYEGTERDIQELLMERVERLKGKANISGLSSPKDAAKVDFARIGTPEIYFGYGFIRQPLGNMEGYSPDSTVNYTLPPQFAQNTAYLGGVWRVSKDYVELVSAEGEIALKYDASRVNIVVGSEEPSQVGVLLDGEPNYSGDDVNKSSVLVKNFQLYNVVSEDYGVKTLLLKVQGKGFKIYTFTFG